jgi:hypothetical protein
MRKRLLFPSVCTGSFLVPGLRALYFLFDKDRAISLTSSIASDSVAPTGVHAVCSHGGSLSQMNLTTIARLITACKCIYKKCQRFNGCLTCAQNNMMNCVFLLFVLANHRLHDAVSSHHLVGVPQLLRPMCLASQCALHKRRRRSLHRLPRHHCCHRPPAGRPGTAL